MNNNSKDDLTKNKSEDDLTFTPWEIENKSKNSINYDQVINQFGCTKFSDNLIQKFESVSGSKAHHFVRRNIVNAHRDLDLLLDAVASSKPIYLYTGRGPSADHLHLGHSIPFLFTKYLQDIFDCPLVIQITDDEKFFFKESITSPSQSFEFAKSNIMEILAFGFNPKKTFVFINSLSYNLLSPNFIKLAKYTKLNEVAPVFGFDAESLSIGKAYFPLLEIVPAYPSTFGFSKDTRCLVPAAMDQDPFFRLARDKAKTVNENKPSTVYLKLLPALKGAHTKMSSTGDKPISMVDSQEEIASKIKKFAYSGGKETLADHRKYGGNCEIDISFQYLKFFMEDDCRLEEIRQDYSSGKMTSGEIKSICIDVIQKFLKNYQTKLAGLKENPAIIDEVFMSYDVFKSNNK